MLLTLTTNAVEVLETAKRTVGGFPARLLTRVAQALDNENENTIGVIKQTRLSFPAAGPTTMEGLRESAGVGGGRLKRSVIKTNARVTGTGITSSIGSNVIYAGVHEFGYQGDVNVPAHTRRITARNVGKSGKLGVQKYFVAEGVAFVRAHTMRLNLPERAPFRRAIEGRAEDYSRAISRAIEEAWASR